MPAPSTWTEQDFAHAVKMRADGRSAGEIARELGKTRNAVIGIMHRNRDHFPLIAPQMARAAKARPQLAPKLRHHMTTTTRRSIIEKPPVMPDVPIVEAEIVVAPAEPVSFLKVTERQCKWPLWPVADNPGPDGLCCGARIDFGTVYCHDHRRLSQGKGTHSEQAALRVLGRAAR